MGLFDWFGGAATTVGNTVHGAQMWAGQQGANVGSFVSHVPAAAMRTGGQIVRSANPQAFVGTVTGGIAMGARALGMQPTRIPDTPMMRSFSPMPAQQFGSRYSPSTMSNRISNAGVSMQISRLPQRASLVPNHFNSFGQQVYPKAQTRSGRIIAVPSGPTQNQYVGQGRHGPQRRTTQERVAGDLDARMRNRTEQFLGRL